MVDEPRGVPAAVPPDVHGAARPAEYERCRRTLLPKLPKDDMGEVPLVDLPYGKAPLSCDGNELLKEQRDLDEVERANHRSPRAGLSMKIENWAEMKIEKWTTPLERGL